jgi:hypothetical protein
VVELVLHQPAAHVRAVGEGEVGVQLALEAISSRRRRRAASATGSPGRGGCSRCWSTARRSVLVAGAALQQQPSLASNMKTERARCRRPPRAPLLLQRAHLGVRARHEHHVLCHPLLLSSSTSHTPRNVSHPCAVRHCRGSAPPAKFAC